MVTIKEIAQQVGISPSTVSIVLSGKGAERKISEGTQKMILEAASRMGYQPNIAARSLRGGAGADELQVALFWATDFRAAMMVRFMDGLELAMKELDRRIRLVVYPYENNRLKDARALTTASDCHAAILCNASYGDMAFLEETTLAIPVVLYNRTCPGYCSVNVDDAWMGALAARALADQGCKTAAVLSGPPVFEGMEIRVHSFELEGRQHGLRADPVRYCENSIAGGYGMVRRRMQQDWAQQRPDGLFCGSARIAHGALRAFWEAGLSADGLPKVVAIGNGTDEQDAHSIPTLSVVNLPLEEMAARCLHLLLEVISGKARPPASVMLRPTYIPRESCGPIHTAPAAPASAPIDENGKESNE